MFLKRVPDDSSELRIHRFLADEEKLEDPYNHTVPLLDEFPKNDDPTCIYMVMPLLRPYYLPELFVKEVVDFMKQVLEDRTVPELSLVGAFDPFLVDFTPLGTCSRTHFLM